MRREYPTGEDHHQHKHGGLTGGRKRWYRAWEAAKRRCHNPNDTAYPNYGGRGIKMCKRWRESAAAFYTDMGDPPKRSTIERINNNRGYSPSNCRWATRTAQARNRRSNRTLTFDGETLTIAEWSERTGLSQHTIANRLDKLSWGVEWVLTQPAAPSPGRKGTSVTFRDKTQSIRAWSRETGIPYSTLKTRLKRGMPVEEALTKPPERRGRGSPTWWENQEKKGHDAHNPPTRD